MTFYTTGIMQPKICDHYSADYCLAGYSRSHGKIAITVITSNGGKTVNGVLFAAHRSNVERPRRLNVLH